MHRESTDAEEVDEDEDVVMTDDPDPEPIAKPKKKRVKKVIPVGRNGLKKKRVVKSRTKKDDKGYMG